jgi:hypothetical protein
MLALAPQISVPLTFGHLFFGLATISQTISLKETCEASTKTIKNKNYIE